MRNSVFDLPHLRKEEQKTTEEGGTVDTTRITFNSSETFSYDGDF